MDFYVSGKYSIDLLSGTGSTKNHHSNVATSDEGCHHNLQQHPIVVPMVGIIPEEALSMVHPLCIHQGCEDGEDEDGDGCC